MEEMWVECRVCKELPPELRGYSERTCSLCGALHCDECLNEAGYCTPCSEKMGFSRDEATPV